MRKTTASGNAEPSVTALTQRDFWADFTNYMKDNPASFKTTKPLPQNWMNISVGNSSFQIQLVVNSKDKRTGIWFNALNNKGNAKQNFDTLKRLYFGDAAKDISPDLEWDRCEEKVSSIIRLYADFDYADLSVRQELFEWLRTYTEKFYKFFKTKIQEMK